MQLPEAAARQLLGTAVLRWQQFVSPVWLLFSMIRGTLAAALFAKHSGDSSDAYSFHRRFWLVMMDGRNLSIQLNMAIYISYTVLQYL